jgi:phosphate starvation-inducible PhoH-like protein
MSQSRNQHGKQKFAQQPEEQRSLTQFQRAAHLNRQVQTIAPRSPGQRSFMQGMKTNAMAFANGPAGSGKTFLGVAMGVSLFQTGKVKSMVFSRPAVETDEHLGALPGDINNKMDPYMRPIWDQLVKVAGGAQVDQWIENGDLEVAPLALMRGRTFENTYVMLDEAQNTTQGQMKMFLTRLGEASFMVVTGDVTQTDLKLPHGVKNGFDYAIERLTGREGIHIAHLEALDIQRHPLVATVLEAWGEEPRQVATRPALVHRP